MPACLALARDHEHACFAGCTHMGLAGMVFVRGYSCRAKPVDCSVSFMVPKKKSKAYDTVADDTDFSVKGAVSPESIYARDAKFNGGLSFSLGPWGCWISRVVQTDK